MMRTTISADGDTITEAGGDAGRCGVGAMAVSRQRYGEGPGAGVPMAKDAGHRRACALEDVARAKGVNATYVSRILRLTLLAPDIVEAILDGRQSTGLQLDDLLEGVSAGVGGPTC